MEKKILSTLLDMFLVSGSGGSLSISLKSSQAVGHVPPTLQIISLLRCQLNNLPVVAKPRSGGGRV